MWNDYEVRLGVNNFDSSMMCLCSKSLKNVIEAFAYMSNLCSHDVCLPTSRVHLCRSVQGVPQLVAVRTTLSVEFWRTNLCFILE